MRFSTIALVRKVQYLLPTFYCTWYSERNALAMVTVCDNNKVIKNWQKGVIIAVFHFMLITNIDTVAVVTEICCSICCYHINYVIFPCLHFIESLC